jgi:hypothetical protein
VHANTPGLPCLAAPARPFRLAAVTLALLLALVTQAIAALPALAKAPALATVAAATLLLVAPQADATELRLLEPGDEVELTGGTAVGYLQVRFRGDDGWAAAAALAISGRVGIPLAQAPDGAAILAAPMPDAEVLGTIPAGGVAILTGRQVDGYAAGSFDGVGGWIAEADLTLPMDPDGTER